MIKQDFPQECKGGLTLERVLKYYNIIRHDKGENHITVLINEDKAFNSYYSKKTLRKIRVEETF